MAKKLLLPAILVLMPAFPGCGNGDGSAGSQPGGQTPVASAPAPQASAPSSPPASEPSRPAAKAAASPAPTAASFSPTPGTVLRDTELKEKPFLDAKTLRKLPAKTALVVIERQGGWLKVQVANQQGWVRLLSVSSEPAGTASTREQVESLERLASGRAGGGNVVATTGIRGLNEEQLKTAQANPEELRRLEGYGATPEAAREYARRHGLEARTVERLAAPR